MTKAQSNTAPEAFDVGSLDTLLSAQEDGTRISIRHPITGEDTGMWVKVVGPDSEIARKARRAMVDRRLKKGKVKIDAEGVEFESRRLLAFRVIAWGGFVMNGDELGLTTDNVVMVFSKYPFIYEQVDAEANDRESFTQG